MSPSARANFHNGNMSSSSARRGRSLRHQETGPDMPQSPDPGQVIDMDGDFRRDFYADIEASVKWFDPQKGYGFVEPADGSGDAFLPAEALKAAGFESLGAGTVLFCALVPTNRRLAVRTIHFVDLETGRDHRRLHGSRSAR